MSKKDLKSNVSNDKINESFPDDNFDDFEGDLSENEIKINELDNNIFQIQKLNEKISNLNSDLNGFNSQNDRVTNENEVRLLKEKLNSISLEINEKETIINSLKNEIKLNEEKYNSRELEISNYVNSVRERYNQIEHQLDNNESIFNSIKKQYVSKLSELENKKYCISCYKEEIRNNKLEIDYIKKNSLIKRLFSPLAYIYLLFKSNPKDLFLNYKLYKSLKNTVCFDIGYYLDKNPDLQNSIWYKYFSLELHYVCKGFDEERKFNKKYFNTKSKQELLDYIFKCP